MKRDQDRLLKPVETLHSCPLLQEQGAVPHSQGRDEQCMQYSNQLKGSRQSFHETSELPWRRIRDTLSLGGVKAYLSLTRHFLYEQGSLLRQITEKRFVEGPEVMLQS